MMQGLKEFISFVIKALPETKITCEWLEQHISECISCLSKGGFNVRAVVTDNHSSNLNAFNCLLYTYGTNDSKLFIQHPDNSRDRFCSNQLGNAVVDGDGKTDFFLSFAEWLKIIGQNHLFVV